MLLKGDVTVINYACKLAYIFNVTAYFLIQENEHVADFVDMCIEPSTALVTTVSRAANTSQLTNSPPRKLVCVDLPVP